MSSSFQVRPAVEHDLPTIAALNVTAFSDSPYEQALWPPHLRVKPGTEDQEEFTLNRMRKALKSPTTHLIVAVDTTPSGEKFAGYAEWIAPEPESLVHDVGGRSAKPNAAVTVPSGLDLQANKQGSSEISKLLGGEDCRNAFHGKDQRKMWTLNSIAVENNYRRQGVAKMLTMWGLKEADKSNEEIWLIASPQGRRLYAALGFNEVAAGSRFSEGQFVMTRFRPASSQ